MSLFSPLPFRVIIAAETALPQNGSFTPTTAHESISGCINSSRWTSSADTFSPPEMMKVLRRAAPDAVYAVFVHRGDIAGEEPAVVSEGHAGGFGLAPVLPKDTGAFHLQFAGAVQSNIGVSVATLAGLLEGCKIRGRPV